MGWKVKQIQLSLMSDACCASHASSSMYIHISSFGLMVNVNLSPSCHHIRVSSYLCWPNFGFYHKGVMNPFCEFLDDLHIPLPLSN